MECKKHSTNSNLSPVEGERRFDNHAAVAAQEKLSTKMYDEVETLTCADPGETSALICDVPQTTPMSKTVFWTPWNWEWIVDLEPGPSDYTYVITDGTLHTFDTTDTQNGLWPRNSTELFIPGNCPWCGGPDWAYDIEVYGDFLLIGSWGGVHVFDITDPSLPSEIGFYWAADVVFDLASSNGVLYIAEGPWVTALSLADPTTPTELNYVWMGELVWALDVNQDSRKLMALTQKSLRRLDIASDPLAMELESSVGLAWNAFGYMKTQGAWTYLNGSWTQTIYDGGQDGLQKRGPHDLRAWVDGRILRDNQAVRVKWSWNELQVWEE